MDSTILDNQNKLAIKELCGLPSIKKWKLQYRATRDGFSAQNFHNKCDGIANTLTVIKSSNENIFGGFTEKAWDSSCHYVEDPKAFIFSLVNKENKPFKIMCKNGVDAIYCHSSYGPTFGNPHDICIANYQMFTEKAGSILAGSYNFLTLEVEVYSLTD